jgi:rare lipoprotein A (peptidoglycan hydrolase)
MSKSRDRCERNNDSAGAPKREPRLRARLRLALTMIAFALLATGSISAAQAATGGISGGSGSEASTSEGSEVAFSAYRVGGASWYGPGLYGHRTACGETLRKTTLGVAHRSLPCGTTVKFVYRGQVLVTQVIDRGPYVHGRAWDLTSAASEALGLDGVGKVRYAIAQSLARPGSGS